MKKKENTTTINSNANDGFNKFQNKLRQLIASDSREKTYEEKIQIADQHIERLILSSSNTAATAKKKGSKSKKRRASKNPDPFFDDDDNNNDIIPTNVKNPE